METKITTMITARNDSQKIIHDEELLRSLVEEVINVAGKETCLNIIGNNHFTKPNCISYETSGCIDERKCKWNYRWEKQGRSKSMTVIDVCSVTEDGELHYFHMKVRTKYALRCWYKIMVAAGK